MDAGRVVGRVTDDRHPLPDVVEVEDGEQLVGLRLSHLHHGDGLRGARAEHKAEVTGSCDESALVWRLSLVQQLT